MKEIGMLNLRRILEAANTPDVEATAEYIFGARVQLCHCTACACGHSSPALQ